MEIGFGLLPNPVPFLLNYIVPDNDLFNIVFLIYTLHLQW